MTTTNSKLFTYNELASRFNVTTSTIRRWFIHYQKFKPTPGTVRVPEDVLASTPHIQQSYFEQPVLARSNGAKG